MLPTARALAQKHQCAALAFPTRDAPLLATLASARERLVHGAPLVVCDLVWQTAPTPELARAFAPAPGRDKVRPVEGYEMQIEHSGFDIVERHDVSRGEWAAEYPGAAAALAADSRGAARVVCWVLVAS